MKKKRNKLGPSLIVPNIILECDDIKTQMSILESFLYHAKQGFIIDPIKESNETIDVDHEVITKENIV